MQRRNPQKLYACKAEEEKVSKCEESSEKDTRTQHDCHSELEDDTPKISLAAIIGISQPQTLKLKGHMKNNNVSFLIYTGSTRNFINVNIIRIFNLFVFPIPNMKFMVENGKKIENVGNVTKLNYKYKSII